MSLCLNDFLVKKKTTVKTRIVDTSLKAVEFPVTVNVIIGTKNNNINDLFNPLS
jgi:hypothetical protein